MPEKDPVYWAALGAEIRTQLQAVAAKKPPHEILGVSATASKDEVQGAFDAWVKRMHPDRLHGAPRELVEKARPFFAALNQARDLMLDQKRRQAQECAANVQTAAERAQEAETEFIRGQRALAASQLEQAEDYLRRAASMEPQNGLYLAERIWAQFLRLPQHNQRRMLPGFIAEMQQAAALSPKSARIAYLLGMLFKAQGNMSTAEQAFKAAVGLGSREARSELRLLDTRRQTGAYPQAPPTAPAKPVASRSLLGRILPVRGKSPSRG